MRRSVTTMTRSPLLARMIQYESRTQYALIVCAGMTAWISSPASRNGAALARILSRSAISPSAEPLDRLDPVGAHPFGERSEPPQDRLGVSRQPAVAAR